MNSRVLPLLVVSALSNLAIVWYFSHALVPWASLHTQLSVRLNLPLVVATHQPRTYGAHRVTAPYSAPALSPAPALALAPAMAAALPQSPVPAPAPEPAVTTNVMFGLIGRDCANEISHVLRNIGSLASYFAQSHVVFVENDSAEDTRAVFKAWGAGFTHGYGNMTVKFLSLQMQQAGKKDLSVLARAPNAYIEQLSLPEYQDVNFLIAVDTDMCFQWEVKRMIAVVSATLPAAGKAWHVLYANGACGWYQRLHTSSREEVPFNTPGSGPVYCDLFALRDAHGRTHTMAADSMISFIPETCNFSSMSKNAAASFSCRLLNSLLCPCRQHLVAGPCMMQACCVEVVDAGMTSMQGGASTCQSVGAWHRGSTPPSS